MLQIRSGYMGHECPAKDYIIGAFEGDFVVSCTLKWPVWGQVWVKVWELLDLLKVHKKGIRRVEGRHTRKVFDVLKAAKKKGI